MLDFKTADTHARKMEERHTLSSKESVAFKAPSGRPKGKQYLKDAKRAVWWIAFAQPIKIAILDTTRCSILHSSPPSPFLSSTCPSYIGILVQALWGRGLSFHCYSVQCLTKWLVYTNNSRLCFNFKYCSKWPICCLCMDFSPKEPLCEQKALREEGGRACLSLYSGCSPPPPMKICSGNVSWDLRSCSEGKRWEPGTCSAHWSSGIPPKLFSVYLFCEEAKETAWSYFSNICC